MSPDKIDQKVTVEGHIYKLFQIGKIVFQQVDEKIFKRLSLELWVGFGSIALLIVGVILIIYPLLNPQLPSSMTGDFRIAVARFAEKEHTGASEIAIELAEGVYLRLEQTFGELDLGFTVTVWGPNRIDAVEGQDEESRAKSASQIAESIGADMLVYGVIDKTGEVWQVTPEFYVSAEDFYQAQEITGQHALGAAFSISTQGGVADRIKVSDEWESRVRVLSGITVGLAYYSVRDFEHALTTFQSTESIEGWKDDKGKQVLYLLTGNTAGKTAALKYQEAVEQSNILNLDQISKLSEDLKLAENYYQKSLALDAEYARAYIGLGSVYYLQALIPFVESLEPVNIDFGKMDLSIATYKRALEATHQPPLADISTKVHFGLGQCYLVQVYAEGEGDLAPAIAEFQAVVDVYGGGANPRVRELAAESHARLARIYILGNHPDWAIKEYQMAISLLHDDPDRQSLYEQALQKLVEGQRQ